MGLIGTQSYIGLYVRNITCLVAISLLIIDRFSKNFTDRLSSEFVTKRLLDISRHIKFINFGKL